jgi:hypothetical protein
VRRGIEEVRIVTKAVLGAVSMVDVYQEGGKEEGKEGGKKGGREERREELSAYET